MKIKCLACSAAVNGTASHPQACLIPEPVALSSWLQHVSGTLLLASAAQFLSQFLLSTVSSLVIVLIGLLIDLFTNVSANCSSVDLIRCLFGKSSIANNKPG